MDYEYLNEIFMDMDWQMVSGELIAEPTESFWEFYRANKEELKKQRIYVYKKENRWIVRDTREDSIKYVSDETGGGIQVSQSNYSLKYGEKLLPYQKPHTANLVQAITTNGSALDGSDAGCGKTFCALIVCKELGLKPLVICPKQVISPWNRVAKSLGVEVLDVLNYEKLRTWNTEYVKGFKEGKKTEIHWNKDIDIIIWDEFHKAKNYKTINAAMVIAAKEQGIRALALSATAANTPLQMCALGYMIGLFNDPKYFWSWIRNYGCSKNKWDFWEFNGALSVLNDIHKLIYPSRGARMRIAELGDQFPETQIQVEAFDMGANTGAIQKLYTELKRELRELSKRSLEDSICQDCKGEKIVIEEGLQKLCSQCNGTGMRNVSHLTIKLRARQGVEILKAGAIADMAEDAVEEGNSVAIFVNFKETLQIIKDRLKSTCIIEGSQKPEIRQKHIDDFQADKSRIIICNIAAGGTGISLADIKGDYPRVSLISPTFSAQDLVQVLGRVHRANGKSKSIQRVIFAADTVEEGVCNSVREKIDRISTLNDGDLSGNIIKWENE